jgi:ABC-type uncharacterized transport system fused permease/ATPase subunit
METGISFVSVGHRNSLKEFHDYLIVLDKAGGFKISELSRNNQLPGIQPPSR